MKSSLPISSAKAHLGPTTATGGAPRSIWSTVISSEIYESCFCRNLPPSGRFASRRAGTGFPARSRSRKTPTRLSRNSASNPSGPGGPGRNAKYAYSDALISLIGDARLSALDMSNRAAAIRAIEKWLSEWFEEHADETRDVPRGDLLAPHAEKICVHSDRARSGTAPIGSQTGLEFIHTSIQVRMFQTAIMHLCTAHKG